MSFGQLNRFAISTFVLGAAVLSSSAPAAIIYSGVVNLPIPDDGTAAYLNVVSGASSTTAFTGYDIAAGGNGATFGFLTTSTASAPATRGFVASTATGPATDLAVGTVIDSTSTFNTGATSGSNFAAGTTGYFGFRFLDEVGGAAHAGWGLISVPSSPGPLTLVSYAYDTRNNTNSSIAAGATAPEPASLSFIVFGGAALLNRRRR